MPLPGGPADTMGIGTKSFGPRTSFLVFSTPNATGSEWKEPGVDKAEFLIRRGDRREFRQANDHADMAVAILDQIDLGRIAVPEVVPGRHPGTAAG